jgi:nucleoside-diphosphate-sugar epimerase
VVELAEGVHWHTVDLLEAGQAQSLMAQVRPTHMLHLAWYAEPGKYWTAVENYRHVAAGLELIEGFAAGGGRRLVVAGTCAEYDWRYAYCREDLTPLAPVSPYGVCKNALHSMAATFARDAGLSLAWGRLFWLYGPHEHPSRLVASVISSLLAGREAVCTSGEQQRPFLHVADVAAAMVALLLSDVEGPVNIASAQAVRIRDLVEIIGRHMHASDRLRFGAVPTTADNIPVLLADTRRLNQEVGWSPRYDLESGLAQTIAWWRAQSTAG